MNGRIYLASGVLVSLALVSCVDPNAPKKSVSIGRMGVMNQAPADPAAVEAAPAPAPEVQVKTEASAPVKAQSKRETAPEVTETTTNTTRNDGIRLPNLLALPEDKDLKASNPSVPKSGDEGGPVIARPPVEKKD